MSDRHKREHTVAVQHQENLEGGVGVLVNVGSARRRRSTVPSTEGEPIFVGRAEQLVAIERALREHPVAIVHGAPGLGKSRLAKEYAKSRHDAYPGGLFFIRFGDGIPPLDLARLLRDFEGVEYKDEPIEDRSRRTLGLLGGYGPALVIYDAVPDEGTLRNWLPPMGLACNVLATSTFGSWSGSWTTIRLDELTEADAKTLVAGILGKEAANQQLTSRLVERAGGVAIELVASARAVATRLRKGRDASIGGALDQMTTSSLGAAWSLLSDKTRLLMRVASTFVSRCVPIELVRSAHSAVGWSASEVDAEIDAARERGLALGDGGVLEIHQLVATFVRAQESPSLQSIRPVLFDGFIKAAEALSERPGDIDVRARFLAHAPGFSDWEGATTEVELPRWLRIGRALIEVGQFEAARSWFERAVAATEKGDARGRVDHASLGNSLHQVGFCLSSLGQFEAARSWFERAVAATEKGDVHGRVDHASLGSSLHQVSFCLVSLGQFEAARPWCERAVAAAEKGDVHGRVDHESLGVNLHQVGSCMVSLGQFEIAQSWFERAASASEKGDVHRRVDHASLGSSLHQVGFCLVSLGQFEAARPWFERAVTAAEKGDVHRRVDHACLGRSLHQVGFCLFSQGRYEAARPWFERAVAAKEKGDVHGRVDHQSLGSSMHNLGSSIFSLGQFEAARPWFERAVTAAEKGDVHGRVDHQSLGVSLHQIGSCFHRLEQFEAARRWFEHAVAAKEKGDVHGRIDHHALGVSLHRVGLCLYNQRQFEAARPWFERAVAAVEKGDVHGRVDHASLGASLHQVGSCLVSQGQYEGARPWFERAAAAEKRAAHDLS